MPLLLPAPSLTHAVGDAGRMIALGDADVIAGGFENTICNNGVGGFQAARALSTSFIMIAPLPPPAHGIRVPAMAL